MNRTTTKKILAPCKGARGHLVQVFSSSYPVTKIKNVFHYHTYSYIV